MQLFEYIGLDVQLLDAAVQCDEYFKEQALHLIPEYFQDLTHASCMADNMYLISWPCVCPKVDKGLQKPRPLAEVRT
jgi:hypothetical protein